MENTNQLSGKMHKGDPRVVNGYFKLDMPSGETKECGGKTSLCRCGKSRNKPFCDESHNKCVMNTYNPWF